jgi:hypothetical protein
MKIKEDHPNIVIAGKWNKYIFTTDWVMRYLLPDETLQMEIPLNIDGSHRISSGKIRILLQDNRLSLIAIKQDDDTLEMIQAIAIKLTDYLPHTPVNAFGINFNYFEPINDTLAKLLVLSDTEKYIEKKIETLNIQHRRCFKIDDKTINLYITNDMTNVAFEINYHYDVSSLLDVKEKINSNSILDLKNHSIELLKEVYSFNF